jgi:serine protease DegS
VLAFGLLAVWRAPYLGVTAVPRDEGCQITSVLPGSPADTAGLEIDDVLVSCNGQPMHSIEEVSRFLAQRRAGDVVEMQILRDHHPQVAHVILERKPTQ